jgi:Kef-type K+ transport system membrane component KefB
MKLARSASSRYELLGWFLFILSAISFISSSVRAGDWLSLIGGVLFLVACFVFIIPLLSRNGDASDSDSLDG